MKLLPRIKTAVFWSLAFWILICPAAGFAKEASAPWWDRSWTIRQPVDIVTGAESASLESDVENAVVLVRLHAGNFNFAAVREDGGDIRFIADDGQTILAHQLESFDPFLAEAFAWVNVPRIAAQGQTRLWVYYGNLEAGPEISASPQASPYPESARLVFHFAERGQPARNAGLEQFSASNEGTPAEGSLIGPGLRFLGRNPVFVEPSPSLEFSNQAPLLVSAWVRPQVDEADGVWFGRVDGQNALRLGFAAGQAFAEITTNGSTTRSSVLPEAAPLQAAQWAKVSMTSDGEKVRLFVNGRPYAEVDAAVPSLNSRLVIGGDDPDVTYPSPGFAGEMDELNIYSAIPSPSAFQFAAVNQSGTEEGLRLVVLGEQELGAGGGGHNEALEHVMLFGDIAANMMFDGWIAVGVCVLMIIVGWSVGINKIFYLQRLEKGNSIFFGLWKEVTADLNLLDESEQDQMTSLAAKLQRGKRRQLLDSPLYHIYRRGLEEIEARLGGKAKIKMEGLSARSMQAIRASMDASLIRENHRLNKGIVFLTIGIAGGPYVGLLGTVVGVMITFALIAKTGEVDVNSIAPGIASALLATVAGLVVAIPALFIYSFLSGRIKECLSSMEVFIDDFVAKIAEFYPPPSEKNFLPVPKLEINPDTPQEIPEVR